MLMMTGAWERRSRYKLDFSLHRLADKIAFRSNANYRMSTSWQRKGDQEPTTKMPNLPTSDKIWRAMIEYVMTNRLYAHFSVAVYLFCTTACQYVPSTAEQSIWNEVTTRLTVPTFHSIRGRYTFFNESRSSPINARATNEWIYIGKQFRKLQSLSVLVCQAMWFGLGLRNMRRGIEFHQRELDSTMMAFMNQRYVASPAIVEALRIKVPLSGMSGIRVWFDGWEEKPFEEPRMLQTNILDDKELKNFDLIEDGDQTYLRVHEFNLPGIPVYLLPLPANIVPGLKIFSGEGSFKPSDGEFGRMGWELPSYYKAYELAVIAKFCGFNSKLKDRYRGPKKFHAPKDSGWVQPHSLYEEERGMPTYFGGVKQGDRLFIAMPQMGNIYSCRELTYKLRFCSWGTYRGDLPKPQRYTLAQADFTNPAENAFIGQHTRIRNQPDYTKPDENGLIRTPNQADEAGEPLLHISRADAKYVVEALNSDNARFDRIWLIRKGILV
ncbi:PREDICTED: uncharacterized protein LOC109152265 isoform X2 [Ipomoea nil]|uniref:uncharacterized protein LOC109152265 isoform X2 n=1 Tax=Ipomoea nil TaxID=35883 RepID=UPI000900A490|nr:PREDICTED: uncharacterized protein LOC109152265 isoform X2 [Ipomoea nil]